MSDQAIVALVMAVAGGIGTLIYYLLNSVKRSLDHSLENMTANINGFIEKMAREMATLREQAAVRSTMMDYLGKELEEVKRQCRKCLEKHKS